MNPHNEWKTLTYKERLNVTLMLLQIDQRGREKEFDDLLDNLRQNKPGSARTLYATLSKEVAE